MATKLRALRKERNLSLRRLEEMTGVHRATLGRYERGVIEPKFDRAVLIADALGVTPRRVFDLIREQEAEAATAAS